MNRLLFEKVGRAAYISHLDLMRTFQRAFMRSGIQIKHTEGFNPHAFISVALPLSVFQESRCELIDFGLVEGQLPIEEVASRLNACLPEGLRVIKSYNSDRPFKHIGYVECAVTLIYDRGGAQARAVEISDLFSGGPLVIMKKSKSGPKETDIRPAIKSIHVEARDNHTVECRCVLSAKEPILNPETFVTAIRTLRPEAEPDFYRICRLAVLDLNGEAFE